MLEGGQSEESWGVHVAKQCWLDSVEKESSISKPHGWCMGKADRSARNILLSPMNTHGKSLVEVEGIVNSRPLVVETINDVNSQAALSPSHILTMKSKVVMPPPDMFGTPDLYCRKRWRRVQHISSKFWSRWRKEFLATLQDRQKWKAPLRNFLIGDIVILKEDTQHNDWRQGLWANSSVVLQMFKLHCCLTRMKRFDPWQRSYQNIQ